MRTIAFREATANEWPPQPLPSHFDPTARIEWPPQALPSHFDPAAQIEWSPQPLPSHFDPTAQIEWPPQPLPSHFDPAARIEWPPRPLPSHFDPAAQIAQGHSAGRIERHAAIEQRLVEPAPRPFPQATGVHTKRVQRDDQRAEAAGVSPSGSGLR